MGPRLQHRRPADPDADDQGGRPLRQTLHGTQRLKPSAPIPDARPTTGRTLRFWRYLRLALHIARGLLTVLAIYPLTPQATHRSLRRRWSQGLLAILGIDLRTTGAPVEPGCMLVANHISWLDIFVINAIAPSAFISKAEVRGWPFIGWLAAKNETVFLRRGSRGHAKIINAEIGALLDAGRNVALFPEGTTTDGSHVLHFHAALLQPAIESGHAIQPMAISYADTSGLHTRAPAYDGDVSLGQCIASIIAEHRITAHINTAPPLGTEGIHRRDLAATARAAILKRLSHAGAVQASLTQRDDPDASRQAA